MGTDEANSQTDYEGPRDVFTPAPVQSTDEQPGRSEGSLPRRDVLKAVATTATAGAVIGNAGCLDILGLTPDNAGVGGLGGGASFQAVTRAEAAVVVSSVSELESEIRVRRETGDVIWATEGRYDLTGRNLTLRGVTIASGRNEDASGAVFSTADRGVGSPVRQDALFTLEQGGRITGVTIRGPLYNYTNSSVIPGYVPFAPGSSWNVREQWRNDWYCRGISIQHDAAQVDNCEIWGWSTAIMVGAQEQAVSPNIYYCHIHNCMMTSAGYCVDVKRGLPTIYRSTFNAYRHALNGYGYADAGYIALECRFGPYKSSHDIDMHGIHNNARDGGASDSSELRYRWRAGGTMLVRKCQLLGMRTIDEQLHEGANAGTHAPSPYINYNRASRTPHVHIRAVPADGFYFEENACSYDTPMDAVVQSSVPGTTPINDNGFANIFFDSNQWGVDFDFS